MERVVFQIKDFLEAAEIHEQHEEKYISKAICNFSSDAKLYFVRPGRRSFLLFETPRAKIFDARLDKNTMHLHEVPRR